MIKTFLIVACMITLSASVPLAIAQQLPDIRPYSPLAEHGEPTPEFNVGELHLQVDGWDIIPIYSIVDNPDAAEDESPWKVRVRGMFVATDPVATTGDNLIAVWYERPDDPAQHPWTANTWSMGGITVAEAALSVKLNLGIPDIQDQLWAMEDLEFVTAKESVPFSAGFIAGDPLAGAINASPTREDDIEMLKRCGYPLADVPFENGDQAEVQANLEHLAETFEMVIESHSWSAGGGRVIWPHHRDPWLIPQEGEAPADPGAGGPAVCERAIIFGDWEPIDSSALCGCVNTPPRAILCQEVTVDASGKVTFRLPWPPPLGTRVELEFAAGTTVSFCVCFRKRFCTGPAKRQVSVRRTDCTWEYTYEYKDHRFSETFWTISASENGCVTSGWIPDDMPFDSEDCGLTIDDIP